MLFDPSTAHGSRGIELTTKAESIHAALVDSVDPTADVVTLLDTHPKVRGTPHNMDYPPTRWP